MVEPQSAYGTGKTSGQHHQFLSDGKNIGKAQTYGIQCIVIGGPDVCPQYYKSRQHQPLRHHDIKHIIFACIICSDSTEHDHD